MIKFVRWCDIQHYVTDKSCETIPKGAKIILLLLEQYDVESMDSVMKDWFRSKEIMRKRYCKNEKLEYVRPAGAKLIIKFYYIHLHWMLQTQRYSVRPRFHPYFSLNMEHKRPVVRYTFHLGNQSLYLRAAKAAFWIIFYP